MLDSAQEGPSMLLPLVVELDNEHEEQEENFEYTVAE